MSVVKKEAFVTTDGRAFDSEKLAHLHERRVQIEKLMQGGNYAPRSEYSLGDIISVADRIARIVAETPKATAP